MKRGKPADFTGYRRRHILRNGLPSLGRYRALGLTLPV
jgi:hypothetical protein